MVMAQNRGIFATVAVFALIFVLIAASFTSCTASLQGASSAIISTSYSSTDEDIYAAENAYRALEEALNTQINQMEPPIRITMNTGIRLMRSVITHIS